MNPREYQVLFDVEDHHWWFVELRREIARAVERFQGRGAERAGRWLDAGSGTGGLLANLDPAGKGRRVGFEISPEGLRFSRSRSVRDLVRGSVCAIPFAGGVFDLVTSVDVLCHKEVREEQALSEMGRCLKPGGILVLQVPAFDWLRGEHDQAVWTNRRYRRREIERLLERAGLDVRSSFYRVGLLFPFAALGRLLARGRKAEEARSDVRPVSRPVNALLATILRAESRLGALGLRLPFGLSIFCVAQKRPR